MTEENLTKKELYDLQKEEKNKQDQSLQNKKSLKRVFLWAVVLVVVGGSVWGLSRLAINSQGPQNQGNVVLDAISEGDWVTGNKESKVILIEYADFQCPACGAYYPLIKELIKEQGANFKLVYRHFPLQQHQNAKPAAYSAEAAGKQGKFWEMESMIFERQRDWSESRNVDDIFLGYAKSLGLNAEQFKKDRESKEIKDNVEADYNGGIKAGVNATPTFFLNGKRIQPQNYEEFVKFINEANS